MITFQGQLWPVSLCFLMYTRSWIAPMFIYLLTRHSQPTRVRLVLLRVAKLLFTLIIKAKKIKVDLSFRFSSVAQNCQTIAHHTNLLLDGDSESNLLTQFPLYRPSIRLSLNNKTYLAEERRKLKKCFFTQPEHKRDCSRAKLNQFWVRHDRVVERKSESVEHECERAERQPHIWARRDTRVGKVHDRWICIKRKKVSTPQVAAVSY